MKRIVYFIVFVLIPMSILSQRIVATSQDIVVVKDHGGMKLEVDGKAFMMNGMNWDYIPIGANFSYSLWSHSDEIIKAALDEEMALLQYMGVNVIRQYTGVPRKWIQYIYEQYGIYTMLNHSFGRYGLTLDGAWVGNTEYADDATQELLLSEVTTLVSEYKDTPGLLLYLLGNENNFGLFWGEAETEDIPLIDRKSTVRAKAMYKLFNEATLAMKKVDDSRPIAICNGDLLFIDLIQEECKDIDILGVNMYRGASFGDAFSQVSEKLNKPILFTEFGADAFNAISNAEDQKSQAHYLLENWKEIYENAYGLGKTGNSLGGFTFQFSDGWWKYGQIKNLSVHDDNASWSNGGYPNDYTEGENNMNEEWFGICAKGPTNDMGLYKLYPRAAYYALQKVHLLNPFGNEVTLSTINHHFSSINVMSTVINARGDMAALSAEYTKKVRLSGFRADISTYSTGGKRITTPDDADEDAEVYPDQLGFDHMQSYYFNVEANPASNVQANVSVNVLGNVATNPIDEIFYENRGRPVQVETNDGLEELSSINRVQIYKADFRWNAKLFELNSFYRTGHYHWGYEGDLFGLYPEANYGPNMDTYNGAAPFGFEIDGKRSLHGLTLAFGPELWWGANPAVLAKNSREVKGFGVTGIYHEDIDDQAPAVSSFAIPTPMTRRATLAIERDFEDFGVQLGAIWSGQPHVGEAFQYTEGGEGNYSVYEDKIKSLDTWGGKIKVTYQNGPFRAYAQSAIMGLVADGGADYTKTFAGWRLKDSGSGNQSNVLAGFAYTIGDFQLAPNFLWQKPIVGPMPNPADLPSPGTSRNILDDPFAVRSNRETVAGEFLLTYDPTPATWMYAWDNDMVEDAPLAISAGFIYRHLPTTQDAAIGIFADGRTTFAFSGAPPAEDLWEVYARIISKVSSNIGLIANVYGGTAQANGSDERTIKRGGGDLRLVYKNLKLSSILKINDWGPYDYHRDFNQTFPVQIAEDFSASLGSAGWIDLPKTRVGIRCTWRSLNEYSPRYNPTSTIDDSGEFVPDETAVGYSNGSEWEIRTYLQFYIGK